MTVVEVEGEQHVKMDVEKKKKKKTKSGQACVTENGSSGHEGCPEELKKEKKKKDEETTVEEGCSEIKKKKRKIHAEPVNVPNSVEVVEMDGNDHGISKKKKKKKQKNKEGPQAEEKAGEETAVVSVESDAGVSKKKKKVKQSVQSEAVEGNVVEQPQVVRDSCSKKGKGCNEATGEGEEGVNSTKKKKRKAKAEECDAATYKEGDEAETQDIQKDTKRRKGAPEGEEKKETDKMKKRKKKKAKLSEDSSVEEEGMKQEGEQNIEAKENMKDASLETEGAEEREPKKKKKKKSKKTTSNGEGEEQCEDNEEETETKCKKNKREKSISGAEAAEEEEEIKTKKKKQKKIKEKGCEKESCMEAEEAPSPQTPAQPSGLGQWSTAQFDNSTQQQKFLRLMGGFKKGFQPAGAGAGRANMALGKAGQQNLQQGLMGEFERAHSRKIDFNNRGAGLGYAAPSNKKFAIDISACRSVRFED